MDKLCCQSWLTMLCFTLWTILSIRLFSLHDNWMLLQHCSAIDVVNNVGHCHVGQCGTLLLTRVNMILILSMLVSAPCSSTNANNHCCFINAEQCYLMKNVGDGKNKWIKNVDNFTILFNHQCCNNLCCFNLAV